MNTTLKGTITLKEHGEMSVFQSLFPMRLTAITKFKKQIEFPSPKTDYAFKSVKLFFKFEGPIFSRSAFFHHGKPWDQTHSAIQRRKPQRSNPTHEISHNAPQCRKFSNNT